MPYVGPAPTPNAPKDLQGGELKLDADADTSITAATDDTIHFKIAGADDFTFTANTFTAESGSTIAAQALTATTITASGIMKTDDATEATSTTDGSLQTDGGLSVVKDAVFGDDVKLLSDSAVLNFGTDNDITVTHVADTGLTVKNTHTSGNSGVGAVLTLQTGDTDVADGNILGHIKFQAPDEGTGTDAILVAAAIAAESEGDFSSSNNATSLVFQTGASEAAATKMTLTSAGALDVTGDITGSTINADGDTSSGDNAAIGYTAGEGLILTGQGSSYDITLKNDADTIVAVVPTGADDLRFLDNAKAEFGTGGDLQIYHDASNSFIADGGTGALNIRGSDINIQAADGSETYAVLAGNGAVTLYHDNSAKLATTSVGTTITGTLIATTSTAGSQTGSVTLDFAANQNFVLTFTGNVTLANPSTEQVGQSGIICCIQDGTGSRTLSLGTDYETAGGAGITLSTAANSVDIIPYFVKASGSIQLGAVQLAFS